MNLIKIEPFGQDADQAWINRCQRTLHCTDPMPPHTLIPATGIWHVSQTYHNFLSLISFVRNESNNQHVESTARYTALNNFENAFLERERVILDQKRVILDQVQDLASRVDEVSLLCPRVLNLESRVMESDQQQQESLANVRSELTIQTRVNDQRAKIVEDLQVELQASRQEIAELKGSLLRQSEEIWMVRKDNEKTKDELHEMQTMLLKIQNQHTETLQKLTEIALKSMDNSPRRRWDQTTPSSSAANSDVEN